MWRRRQKRCNVCSNNPNEPSGRFARLESSLGEASEFDIREENHVDRHHDFMLFVC